MPNKENLLAKGTIWFPILLALTAVGGILLGFNIAKMEKRTVYQFDNSSNMGQGTIEEIIRYIESKYVNEVDREKLTKTAIDNILNQLDPHSSYISKEDLIGINEQLQGNFDGIGIQYTILDDTIFVIKPLRNGPAESAGLLRGDRIVEIGGKNVAGADIDIEEAIKNLRGSAGTTINLKVKRKNSELLPFSLERSRIVDTSIDAGYMIDDKTGYFNISKFSETTYKEFMKIIENLSMNKGLKNLIIDLRNNPGGYLQEATKILNQFFVEKDKLLVYTEGNAVRKSEYRTTGKSFFDFEDIIVLIDENSASASEILAGALQDLDRGTIIGRRSFGKGLVQEQYQLSDGSALRLTVAKYFIPSGRCIQRKYDNGLESYDNDYIHRISSGELMDSTKMESGDTTKYYTYKGREVHGGGGITPDYFVPMDTIYTNTFVITANSYARNFALYNADQLAVKWESDTLGFINKFSLEESELLRFYSFLKKNNVNIPAEISPEVQDFFKITIKANIAKYIYGDRAFYQVLLPKDPDYLKALQIIKQHQQLVERVQ